MLTKREFVWFLFLVFLLSFVFDRQFASEHDRGSRAFFFQFRILHSFEIADRIEVVAYFFHSVSFALLVVVYKYQMTTAVSCFLFVCLITFIVWNKELRCVRTITKYFSISITFQVDRWLYLTVNIQFGASLNAKR